MRIHHAVTLCLLLAAIFGCVRMPVSNAGSRPGPIEGVVLGDPDEAVVRRLRTQWNDAVASRDTLGLHELVSDTVVLTSHILRLDGWPAYLEVMDRNWRGRADFRLRFEPEWIEVG